MLKTINILATSYKAYFRSVYQSQSCQIVAADRGRGIQLCKAAPGANKQS
jgi:hypothetical protein